jgi:hypothetical protein
LEDLGTLREFGKLSEGYGAVGYLILYNSLRRKKQSVGIGPEKGLQSMMGVAF